MKAFQSTKIAALIPTALAVLLSTFAQVMDAGERQAENAFRSFSLRFNQGQYGAARSDVERALAFSPENAYYAAGEGLLSFRTSQRQFDPADFLKLRLTLSEEEFKGIADAAQHYRRTLALNPLEDNNYHNLGWLYALQQQREQSLRCFRQAVALDGSVAMYHLSLGLLYEQGGEDEAAYRAYERAVRLSPAVLDSPFFRDLSARAPEAAERIIRDSISHLEEQARQTPSPIVKGKLGLLYLRANRPDEASAALKEAVTQLPGLSRPWHNLGAVSERRGDEAAMTDYYRRAAFLDAGDSVAWAKLGEVYDRQDNKREAIRFYTRSVGSWVNRTSEHARRAARIYHTQAVIFDDVVPNGFLSYCSPALDVAGICRRLSKLYEEMGDGHLSSYYKDLSLKLSPGR